MSRYLIAAAALGLAITAAFPAMAQYSGSYSQQPRLDSFLPQRDSRDYQDDRDRGSRSNQRQALAMDVESALQARGYDVGTVDGNIDSRARAGIRMYQRDAGLEPTGEVSSQLLSHIETHNLRAGTGTLGQGDLGAAAGQALQQLLNRR